MKLYLVILVIIQTHSIIMSRREWARSLKVSVAWAGERLGLYRQEAIRWYTSHGYLFPDYAAQDLEEDARYAERFGIS